MHTPDVKTRSVLEVQDLSVRFPQRYGDLPVLQNIDLSVAAGECLAVVGESGCGKSLLGLAIADLLPRNAHVSGEVRFRGRAESDNGTRPVRQSRRGGIGIIYQDALTSLNPGMSIGAQLRQVCRRAKGAGPEELLTDVGLPEVERILRSKPYQLSGGQRQRVLIALALAREPELVIADESTTALDVTVQARVIELLMRLQAQRDFSLLFISHDLALVSQVSTRLAVMYAGQLVEQGPTAQVLTQPRHPYTAGLVAASLSLELNQPLLSSIPGFVRPPAEFPQGCRFRDRCPRAESVCASRPEPRTADGGVVTCHFPLTESIGEGEGDAPEGGSR